MESWVLISAGVTLYCMCSAEVEVANLHIKPNITIYCCVTHKIPVYFHVLVSAYYTSVCQHLQCHVTSTWHITLQWKYRCRLFFFFGSNKEQSIQEYKFVCFLWISCIVLKDLVVYFKRHFHDVISYACINSIILLSWLFQVLIITVYTYNDIVLHHHFCVMVINAEIGVFWF